MFKMLLPLNIGKLMNHNIASIVAISVTSLILFLALLKGPFIHHVSIFPGFVEPPPPRNLRNYLVNF